VEAIIFYCTLLEYEYTAPLWLRIVVCCDAEFFTFPLVSVILYRKFCYHRACCDMLIPTVAIVSSFYVVFVCSMSLNLSHFDVRFLLLQPVQPIRSHDGSRFKVQSR